MLNHREYWLAIDQEHVDLKRQGVSDWSPIVEVVVAGDPLAPSAPSISASSADQAIDLTLTKPTTNADGSTCTDFKEFKVYYSASSGIDVTNPTTYDGYFYTSSTSHTYPTTAKTYFMATAWDKNGNESAASSETSATPIASGYDPAVDDYTSNIANVYTGAGIIGIEFQPPKSSWIRSARWKLYYDVDTGTGWGGTWTLIYTGTEPGFLHKGLNETYAYKYKLTVLGEGETETAGTVSDNAGAGYTPNASDNSSILNVTIFAERMIATKEMITQTFIGGKLHSLNWGASAGTELSLDDEVIRLGGSGVGYDSGAGIWLGNDAGAYKFFVGDSAGNKLTWDGSTLSISGAITTGAGSSLDGGYLTTGSVTADKINVTNLSAINADLGAVTAGSIVVTDGTNTLWLNDASDGGLAVGGTTKSSAPFRVDSAGNLTATSATIQGTVTIDPGSSGLANLSDHGDLALLDVVGNAYITDLSASKLTAGDITVGLNVDTGGSIQSANYVAGSTGWKINYDGSAEFQNATIRGTLNADDITAGTLSADRIAAGSLAADKLDVSQLSAISADMGTITAGSITGALVRTSSGTTRAEMATGSYPFAYYYGGDKKFYVDTSGNVYGKEFKDTNGQSIISGGVFQGAKLIDYGYNTSYGVIQGDYRSDTRENARGTQTIWNGVSRTVPSGKKWIVIATSPERTTTFGWSSRGCWQGFTSSGVEAYFKSGTTYYVDGLPAGSYSALYLYVNSAGYIAADTASSDMYVYGKVFWMILEVPA
jgi:hypothetical protein